MEDRFGLMVIVTRVNLFGEPRKGKESYVKRCKELSKKEPL